jgi:molybdopterin-guanine dinucleotide biosynthesis protein A
VIEDVACVILAGGKSSRMGEDKALLPFGGFDTLTEFQLSKFKPYFKDIYISTKSKAKFNFDANFIEDDPSYKESAPLVAIKSILDQIDQEFAFILGVDLPFFRYEEFKKLYKDLEETKSTIIAKSQYGLEPLSSIYHKSITSILEKLIEQKRFAFANLFERITIKEIYFEQQDCFINLNDKDIYYKYYKGEEHD